MKLRIKDITIGSRFRKSLGDLTALKASLDKTGQLQAVGVDVENNLIFGARRVAAAKELGWKEIEVTVLDLGELRLDAENDENECRLDFTPSERVAIADAIKDRIGSRQGQKSTSGQLAGSETREIAAKSAGFDSQQEYSRAKKVVEKGTPELVAAMDSGAASVSAAATVADLPKKEQKEAVKSGTVAEKAKETKEKPRCELCKRKGLFRLDSCPECLDLQKAKKPEKYKPATFDDEVPITNPRTLPPTVVPINPDAEGVTSAAAGGGHPFLDLLADIRSLSARMTKTIKADGEDEHRLYTYLTYCGLLDHDPAKNGAAYFLPLRGVSKLVDMAGEGGKVKTKTQVENAYLIACGGKQAWIPPVTARRRAGKTK